MYSERFLNAPRDGIYFGHSKLRGNSVKINLVVRTVALLFLVSLAVHLNVLPFPGGDSTEIAGPGPALNLIFFEDYPYTIASETGPGTFKVVELPSAEFPQQFSCMYAPFRKLQRFMLPKGIEIPRKVILLSIHTLTEQALRGKQTSYQSTFTDLSYQLKATNWTDSSYQLVLKGEYKGFKFSDIPVEVRANRTMLATIRKTSRQTLYAVFTPVQSIPLFSDVSDLDTGDFQHPRLIESPQPSYPTGLSSQGSVIIRGIVTTDGKLDPDRFVFLECPHPLLAESALETIIDNWKFLPGTHDGVPVEALTTIEVPFIPEKS